MLGFIYSIQGAGCESNFFCHPLICPCADRGRCLSEVLGFAGLQEGDHVADISSLGQYFMAIMAEAVGPAGRIDMHDLPYMERFGAVESGNIFASSHANCTNDRTVMVFAPDTRGSTDQVIYVFPKPLWI